MTAADTLRVGVVVFAAAMLQTVFVSSMSLGGGTADLLLVVVVSLGLLRGAIPGAVVGFAGGLVVDLLTLDTLGRHVPRARRSPDSGRGGTERPPDATAASPRSSPSA